MPSADQKDLKFTSLLDLPYELIFQIMKYTNLADVFSVSLVSRKAHKLIEGDYQDGEYYSFWHSRCKNKSVAFTKEEDNNCFKIKVKKFLKGCPFQEVLENVKYFNSNIFLSFVSKSHSINISHSISIIELLKHPNFKTAVDLLEDFISNLNKLSINSQQIKFIWQEMGKEALKDIHSVILVLMFDTLLKDSTFSNKLPNSINTQMLTEQLCIDESWLYSAITTYPQTMSVLISEACRKILFNNLNKPSIRKYIFSIKDTHPYFFNLIVVSCVDYTLSNDFIPLLCQY